MTFIDLLNLARPHQWYKNLVIFIPLIFSLHLFSPDAFLRVSLGFLSLCFVSSAYYIVNDLFDAKKDAAHPEKRHRPLAAGKISFLTAGVIALFFLGGALLISSSLHYYFFLSTIFLFLNTVLYTILLKKEFFLDAIAIACNFVIKSLSGVFLFLENVQLSPWITVCIFSLALFLVFGKRRADVVPHPEYKKEVTDALLLICATILLLSFVLYAIINVQKLIITFPIAFYVLARYLSFIFAGSPIARSPEKAFTDVRILLGILLWIVTVVFVLYVI